MKAYAKVNFILKVFPKTPQETKHKIKSWFCLYPKLYDQVLIRNASKTTIECKYDNQNISINQKPILLVIEYLAKLAKCKINLHIIIHKNIPPMSGLGGSATDIACIINWIVKQYRLKLLLKHWKYIALYIGSDVPFFMSGYRSAWVSGYGEKVVPYTKPIPRFRIVLTGIKMSTIKVYQAMNNNYKSKVNIAKAYQSLNSKHFNKDTIYNDMWVFANKLNQRFNKLSRQLLQTKNIILSGSGGSFIEIY